MATMISEPPTAPKGRNTRDRAMRIGREHIGVRVLLILLCGYYLLPFYWMFVNSLKSNEELAQYPPTWFPRSLEFENYSRAMNVFPFWTFFTNTMIITVFSVIGVAISVPLVAYGFSRVEWPGRDKVFYVVLATVFIPYPALIIALFDIFARLDWVNTFYPLIVPFFFCFIPAPFWIFIMRQFLMQIPRDLSDAARIDGAHEFRIMYQIILPQAWPALAAVCLFAALDRWNDFLGPLLFLHDPDKYTLSVGLQFFQSQTQYDIQFNLLMAASVLVVIPVLILFFTCQRFFVEGVTVSSIK